MKKETSYQKLKRELSEANAKYYLLKDDFRQYTKGNIGVKVHYDVLFKIEDDTEKMVWYGSTSKH